MIDTILLDSSYSSSTTILAGNTDMPSGVAFETPYANLDCTNPSVIDSLTGYNCTGSTVSTDFYVGSQHDLGITLGAIPLVLPSTPIGLALTPSDSQVSMIWNSANNTDTYTLAWNVDGGAYTEIAGLTGTGYLHTGLTNGAYYCYKVRGVNTDGPGEY